MKILETTDQIDFNYPIEFFEHVAALWDDTTIKSYFMLTIQPYFIDSTKQYDSFTKTFFSVILNSISF